MSISKIRKNISINFLSKIIGVIEEDADQSEEMMSSLMTTSTGSNVTIIEQGTKSVQLNFWSRASQLGVVHKHVYKILAFSDHLPPCVYIMV